MQFCGELHENGMTRRADLTTINYVTSFMLHLFLVEYRPVSPYQSLYRYPNTGSERTLAECRLR